MKCKMPSSSFGTSSSPQTIAVIGGGPAAMFFCHALEIQKKELLSRGEDVSSFPIVTCFERAPGPGGVWRPDRTHGEDPPLSSTDAAFGGEEKKDDEALINPSMPNMYSGLWTNAPKEMFEFSDYTFRDHFGDVRMPTHLPRKHVLEYMLARVTKNCPDFFETYFCFRTTVVHAKYNAAKKFCVSLRDDTTGFERTEVFDKCLWACGWNGVPNIPRKLQKKFKKGNFPGRVVHSSDTSTFKEDVDGKNVLTIGGGLSAEDLALMAIKEGARKVYCICRSDGNYMCETTRWPYDKAEFFPCTMVGSVNGSEVTLRGCYYEDGKYRVNDEVDEIVLSEIDTVLFCTGYTQNHKMLDEALRKALPADPEEGDMITIPKDWTMQPNELTKYLLGEKEIVPDNHQVCLDDDCSCLCKRLYKGVFSIDDPNMIFFQEFGEVPLLSLDVVGWMVAKVVSNQIALPCREEMKADNLRMALDCLQSPICRMEMDWKYQEAMDEAVDAIEAKGDEAENEFHEKLWKDTEYASKFYSIPYRHIGEIMNRFRYPVSYLNPDGVNFSEYFHVAMINGDADSRDLKDVNYDKETEIDGWRTFRDAPSIAIARSYFTGIHAKPLPKPWMKLDGTEKLW